VNLEQFSPYKVIQLYDEIAAYRNHEVDLFQRYPVHVKIDLTESCNQACSFCFYGDDNRDIGIKRDNITKGNHFVPLAVLQPTLLDLAAGGTKAITLIGGGEPLLYPHIKKILQTLSDTPMQFGVVSNGGRPMDEELLDLLSKAAWLRLSLDTLDPDKYLKLHRPKNPAVDNLPHTLQNLKAMLERRKNGMAIGASFLLNPANYTEIVSFARELRDIGLDYVEYKPMYLDRLGEQQKEFFLGILPELEMVKKLATSQFKVIVLMDRMSDSTFVTRDFTRCWVNGITTHIGVDGQVYPCCVLAYANGMEYGNLHEQNFRDIWLGERRLKINERLTPERCPRCWSDKTNELIEHILYETKHPNFI